MAAEDSGPKAGDVDLKRGLMVEKLAAMDAKRQVQDPPARRREGMRA